MTSTATPIRATTTYDGASLYTGLSVSTLRRMVKRGEVPTIRLGRRVLLRYDDLDRLLHDHEVAA